MKTSILVVRQDCWVAAIVVERLVTVACCIQFLAVVVAAGIAVAAEVAAVVAVVAAVVAVVVSVGLTNPHSISSHLVVH